MLSMFQVPHTTLVDRIKGRPCRKDAHQSQQLLSQSEEAVLCDWIGFHATIAKPLDIQGIQILASAVSGKQPGKNWVGRYKKHQPEVCQSRPRSLDPKQAQNFNPSNVAGFYNLLKAIYDVYPSLPPQHIWNMDEKGLQLGGGRKRLKKYFHLKSLKRSKFYQISSDNLELVTIVRTALALALQLCSVPCRPTLTDARPTSPTPQARALDLALLVSSDRRVSIPVPRPGRRTLTRSGTLVG